MREGASSNNVRFSVFDGEIIARRQSPAMGDGVLKTQGPRKNTHSCARPRVAVYSFHTVVCAIILRWLVTNGRMSTIMSTGWRMVKKRSSRFNRRNGQGQAFPRSSPGSVTVSAGQSEPAAQARVFALARKYPSLARRALKNSSIQARRFCHRPRTTLSSWDRPRRGRL